MIRFIPLFVFASVWFAHAAERPVDFNRDIAPVLSNTCFKCHGPDGKERKGGTKAHPLRLDTEDGATADYAGSIPIVPGHPEKSALVARVTSTDADEIMPPPKSGKSLNPQQIELLKKWVEQGAKYAKHWSYVKPARPALPEVGRVSGAPDWPRNGLDNFILARLEKENLKPQPEADRYALIRRVSLDVTGLPPTIEEVDAFVNDKSPDAYEKLVDRLLAKPAYGEHWARLWLDLARYADSGGYASDTPRTIWAFRDYTIKSFNENKPFDQFTVEQIAGDLLPNPTDEQLIATAFHRNTMTNTEGGTTREEFRNAAVVDRVNTTMAVWMGTSFNCAQCHDHKYDPLPQKDYFRFFAIFNNSEDADRADEEPTFKFLSQQQVEQKRKLEAELAALESKLTTPTPETLKSQAVWEKNFPLELKWTPLTESSIGIAVDGGKTTDTVSGKLGADVKRINAIRIEALPGGAAKNEKSAVVTRVHASIVPPAATSIEGQFVRVELSGKATHLMLAEVQVFSGGENVALKGTASQISTDYGGDAKRAIDGNTDGDYFKSNSVSHTGIGDNLWWEVDLKREHAIEGITVWNRTDGGNGAKLKDAHVIVLDKTRSEVWRGEIKDPPSQSKALDTGGARTIQFASALADAEHNGYDADAVVRDADPKNAKNAKKNPKADKPGWNINFADGKTHALTLIASAPADVPAGATLHVSILQDGLRKLDDDLKERFRISTTSDARAAEWSRTPENVVQAIVVSPDKRSPAQRDELTHFYLSTLAPELKTERANLVSLKKQLDEMKPNSVPVMRELAGDKRRKTKIQFRGNYLSLGDEVSEGVPAAFHPLAPGAPVNRFALAKWLVDENNPLTPRVIANRYWEQVFGIGLVRTSEEFGSQGEPPSNPELLDWLATELIAQKWDMKRFVKLLVTSAAYRQSSKVTPELIERDPDNRLLSRGPRFRMSAEMVRDQALACSGLLSSKMYGPSVKPPRPSAGLTAAFGGNLDWETSKGEDKYRRALYTEVRRTAPYPSTATFDAPSREICTLRRVRTNTPLQALVTLNDPVYVESAQALARRMAASAGSPREKAVVGFRACLARPPNELELDRLIKLYDETHVAFLKDLKSATSLATMPLGPAPAGADVAELAAWTTVANVMMNLDEFLMKR
ncbi:MAG TPA: DUF1553 domain-containing protein [Planctomycetota bacterium]|nr:DUF1553 domain-containing protein [Planctomycetota bacterium]